MDDSLTLRSGQTLSENLAALMLALLFAGCGQNVEADKPAVAAPAKERAEFPKEKLDENYSSSGPPNSYSVLSKYSPDSTESISQETDEFKITGVVRAADGSPAPDAVVACWCTQFNNREVCLGKTTTDNNGRYTIDASALRSIAATYEFETDRRLMNRIEKGQAAVRLFASGIYSRGRPSLAARHRLKQGLSVALIAVDKTNALALGSPQIILNSSKVEYDLRLCDRSGVVAGTVVDNRKKPLAGQLVRLRTLYCFRNAPDNKNFHVSIPFPLTAETDSNGRFVFTNLPPDVIANIAVQRSDGQTGDDERVWTSPDSMPTGLTRPDTYANPCRLYASTEVKSWNVTGRVVDVAGQPVVGALVRTAEYNADEYKTKTNENGEYDLEIKQGFRRIDFLDISHDDEEHPLASSKLRIDWLRVSTRKPLDPVTLSPARWVTGRVVNVNNEPLADVKVMSDHGVIAVSGADGQFRGVCRSKYSALRFLPAFLAQSEQTLFEQIYPVQEFQTPSDEHATADIKDVSLPVAQNQGTEIRVLMPDGRPAQNASVQLWTTYGKRKTSYQLQLVDIAERHTYAVISGEDGACRLQPTVDYAIQQYAVATFPATDPQFFGMLRLSAVQQVDDSMPQSLQLHAAQEIRGQVEFNRQPAQGLRVMATPVFNSAKIGPDISSFVRFEAASDSSGNYSVRVPESDAWLVDFVPGSNLEGTTVNSRHKNLPVRIERESGNNTATKFVDGPKFSLFRGNGVVGGQVLGSNGKGFETEVFIDLPPGYAILDLLHRGIHSDENGNYDHTVGRFELRGIPDGAWNAYASVRRPMTKRKGNLPSQDSSLVQVKGGDTGVVIRLTRHSRL